MSKSIGAVEFRSISKGIEAADAMVKAAEVDVLYFKTICPGRFLVILSGDVGAIKSAVEEGLLVGNGYIVDSFTINGVHEEIVQALKKKSSIKIEGAIGIMETSSICSGIEALDKSLKGGAVNLVKLQLAAGIGGKLIYIISGSLSDVEYAMKVAEEMIDKKRIVNVSIIPSPDELIIKYLN